MSAVAPVLGVLAGVCAVANTIPYIRDIVRGSTRPHRGTWLVWAVLAIVVYLSQRADGASWSLLMAGAQAMLTSLVFVLAIRHGEGGLCASDVVLTAVAGAGVGSETLASFAHASLGGALATGAVASAEPALLVYPVYFCAVNAAIALLIHRRRTALAATLTTADLDRRVLLRGSRG